MALGGEVLLQLLRVEHEDAVLVDDANHYVRAPMHFHDLHGPPSSNVFSTPTEWRD
jgi:hypothetical protein